MTASPSPEDTVTIPVADDEPPQDGLAAELAQAAPRRWRNRATIPLIALALVAGGFLGGVLTEQKTGSGQRATAGFPGGANFPAGGFAAGGYGQRGAGGTGTPQGGIPQGGTPQGGAATAPAAGRATTGTVKLVQGATIYVETADGTVITVKTGTDTSVRTSAPAKLSDIKAGAKVSVQGAAAGEDAVTATTVTTQ
ncbi:hypothetical protein AB0M54_33255 [Actinoplanes sp. NPDC051470]|uniref:hypothetical protein n=1 Tax=Actinoplanes sp. NPDC051470 TaxID=3157224 RepID=UPI00342B8B9E